MEKLTSHRLHLCLITRIFIYIQRKVCLNTHTHKHTSICKKSHVCLHKHTHTHTQGGGGHISILRLYLLLAELYGPSPPNPGGCWFHPQRGVYTNPLIELHYCQTFTHSRTHSHTDRHVDHARRQPARQEQLG
jgi:hypothetical protein